jgi:hypothetical protein
VPRRIGLSLDVAAAAARLGVFVAVFLLCELLAYAARSLELSLGPYRPSIDIVVAIVGAPVAYLVLRVLALGPSWSSEEEGRPAVVREKDPLDDPDETHGVCADHKAQLKAPDNRLSVPGSEWTGEGR